MLIIRLTHPLAWMAWLCVGKKKVPCDSSSHDRIITMPKFSMPGDERLRELIVYVAHRTKGDPLCGAVKFNKLLYYADFTAYRKLHKAISGAEYQHLPEGPAPRRLLPARDTLIEQGAIEVKSLPSFTGEPLQKIVAKRKPYSLFSKDERKIIDDVVKAFWNYTGKELSDLSHKELGWRLTKDFETIHYRTAWLSSEPLTQDQIELGKKVAERHGLLV
jgi:uncharacterized phage-associated protein